ARDATAAHRLGDSCVGDDHGIVLQFVIQDAQNAVFCPFEAAGGDVVFNCATHWDVDSGIQAMVRRMKTHSSIMAIMPTKHPPHKPISGHLMRDEISAGLT